MSFATAATAVVFEPFESSMTDTRSGPKNVFCTAARSCSPALMSVPPMKIAVLCRSFGPAREDRAVDEVADGVDGHAAVAQYLVRTAVVRDDAIEHARRRRAVEVQKDLTHTNGAGGWVLVLVAG